MAKRSRIDKSALTFGIDSQYRDAGYIEWIKTQPCILTGMTASDYEAVDPMHIGTAGKGLKVHDYYVLPVRHSLHALGHQKGEVSMLRQHAPDWLIREAFRAYAKQMYEQARKSPVPEVREYAERM